MNIGQAARASGLPPKTIRYYEDIDLIRPSRGDNGYRDFGEADIHKLDFLARSRSLGFSIDDCRTLLSLYEDSDRASSEVKRIASQHLTRIGEKIDELEGLRRTLELLIDRCHGDDRPDCPILDDLAAGAPRTR